MRSQVILLALASLVIPSLSEVIGGPPSKLLNRMDHSGDYTYNITECVGKYSSVLSTSTSSSPSIPLRLNELTLLSSSFF